MRAHKRFRALRDFAVEGGQAELDRQALLRKEAAEEPEQWAMQHRNSSTDSIRTPTTARAPGLSNVPEEGGAFAIGDDEDSDDDNATKDTPAASSRQSADGSAAPSVAESTDESLPTQLRGMSEKARGKMPAHASSFSRQTSNASLNSMALSNYAASGSFEPSAAWVSTFYPPSRLKLELILAD